MYLNTSNITNSSFIVQGNTLFTSHDLTLWMLQNLFASFLLGVFMGLGAALFYASCEKYIVPWIAEKVRLQNE